MKIFLYPSEAGEHRVNEITQRGLGFSEDDYKQVSDYIKDVRARGDRAVVDYTNQFDSRVITEDNLKVTPEEFDWAEKQMDDVFLKSLDRAVSQMTRFHEQQRQKSWIDAPRSGVMVGQLVRPVGAAGIYAPGAKGGKTP
ncbi:MAG: histidinol dehydrogenase, partial [Desulfamplus sp.]|nr:histidinol dehydrogenase [Desulfamplus sp.]